VLAATPSCIAPEFAFATGLQMPMARITPMPSRASHGMRGRRSGRTESAPVAPFAEVCEDRSRAGLRRVAFAVCRPHVPRHTDLIDVAAKFRSFPSFPAAEMLDSR